MKLALLVSLLTASTSAFAATIDGGGLIHLLVYLVIFGLIFWVIWWALGYFNLPEPFNKVARVILGLVALIFVINLLLGLVGSPLFRIG